MKSNWPEWLHETSFLEVAQRLQAQTQGDVVVYVYNMSIVKLIDETGKSVPFEFSPAVSVWNSVFQGKVHYYHVGMVSEMLNDMCDGTTRGAESISDNIEKVNFLYMRRLQH